MLVQKVLQDEGRESLRKYRKLCTSLFLKFGLQSWHREPNLVRSLRCQLGLTLFKASEYCGASCTSEWHNPIFSATQRRIRCE